MSRQLSCRDMCKIVSWSDHHFSIKINMNFTRFGLWAHKSFVKWIPGFPMPRATEPHRNHTLLQQRWLFDPMNGPYFLMGKNVFMCHVQVSGLVNSLSPKTVAWVFNVLLSNVYCEDFVSISSIIAFKVLLQWNSTSVYTSCTYSTYHLELALGTFICHFISACLVCHTS